MASPIRIPGKYWLLAALLAAFAAATFALSPGLFTLDEYINYLGAHAMMGTGSYVFANGAPGLASYQLTPMLMVNGPEGIVPQYPPGMAVLGAPLLAAFGTHGLMLVNALAAAVTVWLLCRMAARHFGGAKTGVVAALLLLASTFFLEYAFAVWPHSVETMCLLGAMALVFDCLSSDHPEVARALAIGALVGLGQMFRADAVLALPAIGLALFVFTARPYLRLALVGAGFAPFMALSSWINHAKFGTWSPVSYGQSGGGDTALGSHILAIAALAVLALALVGVRLAWARAGNRKPIVWAGAVLFVVGLVAAHGFVERYLHGFWALVVDATTIHDTRSALTSMPDGTVLFWGYWKKALGQSMPWLALLFAAPFGKKGVDRKIGLTVLMLAVVWSLPFFPKDWHGGLGSNMRYFLPLVPFACALAAALLADLWSAARFPFAIAALGLAVGSCGHWQWVEYAPSRLGGASQILPTWLFLAISALAFASGIAWRGQRWIRTALLLAATTGVGAATMISYSDFWIAQHTRDRSVELGREYGQMPMRSIAYVPGRFMIGWVARPGHVVAQRDPSNGRFDYRLIGQAFAHGYRVFVWPGYVTRALRERHDLQLVPTGFGSGPAELLEIVPAPDRQ
ncbi:ArnT family glycosyltransferase [Tsuneonella mangrovi]|uniref:ArnT family glycosyltransferase n=1 Tax=Tsuneonella mangrovi TaxID=1982042 RepID=UPI000BA1DB1E|nr:glycosyltransferase family 39 protein [Tsuneonella mangrovi]